MICLPFVCGRTREQVCAQSFVPDSFLSMLCLTADPEYMAFLEQLDKPTEYLPSAEIQLERREAEKAASLG